MSLELIRLVIDLMPAGLFLGGFWYLHRIVALIQSPGCPACRTQRCTDCGQVRDAERRLG